MKPQRLYWLLSCVLLFGADSAIAQRFFDKQLYVVNWGYGRNNAAFDLPDSQNKKLSFGNMPITFEYFSRHAYFHSDLLTPMIDLCLGAFNNQYWYGFRRDDFIYKGGDWPMARLAFGGYIGNIIGLYGGGQWSYSRWTVTGKTNYDFLYGRVSEKGYGGHLYGLGIHNVVNLDRLLIRNSVMYDFVTEGFKGKTYATALTWDAMAIYSFTDTFGVFVNYVYSARPEVMSLSKFRFGLTITFDE